MAAEFKVDGIAALRQALARVPHQLTHQILGPVVSGHLDLFERDLKAAYPEHEGVLRGRVVKEQDLANPLRGKVRSKAPHAHLYEQGTVRRFTKGSGAYRGTMPAAPTFVPMAIRVRKGMVRAAGYALRTLRIPGFTGTLEVRQA